MMNAHTLSEEWLALCEERSLGLRRCDKCDVNTFVMRRYCSLCLGELRWHPASGEGPIFTFSIVGKSQSTGAGLAAPYTVAYVSIDGTRLLTNVRHGSRHPRIGDHVKLDWAEVGDRVVPIFVSAKE